MLKAMQIFYFSRYLQIFIYSLLLLGTFTFVLWLKFHFEVIIFLDKDKNKC